MQARRSVIPASITPFMCSTEIGPSSIHPRAAIEPSTARSNMISEYFRISTANSIEPDEVASTCASVVRITLGEPVLSVRILLLLLLLSLF